MDHADEVVNLEMASGEGGLTTPLRIRARRRNDDNGLFGACQGGLAEFRMAVAEAAP